MAFLNDISRKATEVAAKTVLKTQEAAETVRLNNQVYELEKILEESYKNLGKRYVEIHMYECEDELSELVNRIIIVNNQLINLQKKLQEIRSSLLCPNCGAQITPGISFCSSCGFRIPSNADLTEYIFCEKCGAKNKKGTKFCTSCGMIINYSNMEQQIDNVNNKNPDYSTKTVEKICPNCGNIETEEDMLFCSICGTKL